MKKIVDSWNLAPHQKNFLQYFLSIQDIKDRDILELGGAMPRELVIDFLGANSWTCLQSEEYAKYRDDNQTPSSETCKYQTIFKNAEDFLECTNNKYDIIFSIAAFEHFLKLPRTMATVSKVLRWNGTLFSIFAPIWSGPWGNHWTGAIPNRFEDRIPEGSTWTSQTIFSSPWDHLLLGPTEFLAFYSERFDRVFAEELTYETYQSPQINRMFFEDYEYLFTHNYLDTIVFKGIFDADLKHQSNYIKNVDRVRNKFQNSKYANFVSSGILVLQRKIA